MRPRPPPPSPPSNPTLIDADTILSTVCIFNQNTGASTASGTHPRTTPSLKRTSRPPKSEFRRDDNDGEARFADTGSRGRHQVLAGTGPGGGGHGRRDGVPVFHLFSVRQLILRARQEPLDFVFGDNFGDPKSYRSSRPSGREVG